MFPKFSARTRRLFALTAALMMVFVAVPSSIAGATVEPGSFADLKTTVAGPASANGGGAFTYTVMMENNSLPGADGATFSDSVPAGSTGVTATCTASNGAGCPTAANFSVSNSAVTGTLGAFPYNAPVVVTVRGFFGVGNLSVTDSATITPPPGVTDPDQSSNASSVSTSINLYIDVSAVLTSDATTVSPGDTVDYTAVLANAGPSAANGSYFRLDTTPAASALYSWAVHVVSC